jgi:2-keto-4-pentenoate hydratase/2-oxohepta-3-ene-1,7-dioic acid hydratase in catechol pathway
LKLISYERDGERAVGVLVGESVAPVLSDNMTTFLASGEPALAAARKIDLNLRAETPVDGLTQLGEVELLPPVPNPPKCLCVARNYAAHAAETGRELPTHPSLFLRLPRTLVGDGAPIVVPPVSDRVDWEGELAVVIGKPGRYVSEADALAHVAGYSIFNDVSIRDFQKHTQQFTPGKNFDASGPFGPALVTADEVPDPMSLAIETRVNGELKQAASSGEMVFGIAAQIAYISQFTELEPGDVIATGTPAGVGVARKPPEFLRPGDVCTVAIEGLGELRSPVVAASPR